MFITENDPGAARELLEGDPELARQLYAVAVAMAPNNILAGSYHHNKRVGNLLVRLPAAGADKLDLTLIRECDVLRAIKPFLGNRATRLVYEGRGWSVHMFEEGRTLHDVAPTNHPVPRLTLFEMADLFSDLVNVAWQGLPLYSAWPPDGDSAAFGRNLAAHVAKIHRPQFRALGIPKEPLRPIRFERLVPRPFQLLHNDLHRRNVIIRPDKHAVVVDWELALIGDPVYDMARHLHLMRYSEEEQATVLGYWLEKMPSSSVEGWEPDLQIYLQFNQVMSAIIDTVRVMRKIEQQSLSQKVKMDMIAHLTAALNTARPIWSHRHLPLDVDYVAHVVQASGVGY